MLFVVLCPGTPEVSTSSVSGLLLPMSFSSRCMHVFFLRSKSNILNASKYATFTI